MNHQSLELTFDDGPSPDTMPAVLDLLAEYHVHATFFVWGQRVSPDNIDLLRRAAAEGHELANHTMHHPHMAGMNQEEIAAELQPLQNLLCDITGKVPSMFRPPYLETSQLMQQVIPMPLILGVDSRDWTAQTSAAERVRLVQEAARDGVIILMHCFPGNDATLEALKVLLPWFAEQDFRVTTVSGLFAEKGIQPVAGKIYSNVFDE